MKTVFTLVFPVQPVQRPDGSLNEDRMLSAIMDALAAFNGELHLIQDVDRLLGIALAEDGGGVEAVVRFDTDREVDFSSEHVEGSGLYIHVEKEVK